MGFCGNCTAPSTGAASALFASALNLLVATQTYLTDDFKSAKIYDGKHFHFIIIGAGSCGSVVASRLSEIRGWNILLLEAGPKQPTESKVPQFTSELTGSKYDWQYSAINNGKTNQAYKNGRVPWPRGKMLGGTSSLSAMFYVRGNKEDYRSWENAGNPSWTTKNVYAHFKKAETFQNQMLLKNPSVSNTYGFNGPQILNRFNSTEKTIYENILNACDEIGFKKTEDINTVKFKSPGISSFLTVNAASGQRYSSYQSYLIPVRRRQNLKIITNAFVTRILINKNTRAYGVEVNVCGKRIKVYADLEVIVSAGTINTPQLLMLSGVGPKHHLESKNISCKVNLKSVGKNLQEHFATPIPIYADQPDPLNENNLTFETIRYLFNRTGLLAESNEAPIQTLFARNISAKYPDFQTFLIVYRKNSTAKIAKRLSFYNESIMKSFIQPAKYKSLFYFVCNFLHPMSRGTILLNTKNPYDKPIIDANFFSDPRDLQFASEGITMLTKIVSTTYFKSLNASLHRIKLPECDQFVLNSNRYWECQTKNTAFTAFHAVGTAKMGPNSSDSVVDNYLKVHNVKSLRVIDASIMPTIPSANTHSPTIMIGEMGSSMIKAHYDVE